MASGDSELEMILVKSSDDKTFKISKKAVEKSKTIHTMLEDCPDESDVPINLPNVSSAILKKVIEWCEYHKDDPPPAPEPDEDDYEQYEQERRTDDIPQYDQQFLKVEQSELFEIILAANYLDIKGLLDNGCKTVANMMKGKTVEEVREMFNIENDFTPEEEEQIRKENAWCED